jgi:putative ABC transport system permease protein
MIKNYIKVAFRNLIKQKFYSVINILGLAVGITCSLLIGLYIYDELSYDTFHDKSDRIFRVGLNASMAGSEFSAVISSAPFLQGSMNEFPEIENGVRLYKLINEVTRYEDKVFNEKKVFFADSTFFQVFDFNLLKGSKEKALKEPNSVVISQSTAIKYFGSNDPIGKVLTIGDYNSNYTVSGVIQDCPTNSHFHYDILLSMSTLKDAQNQMWVNNNYYTYLLLNDKNAAPALESKLRSLVEKYVGPQVEQFMGMNLKAFEESGNKFGYFLQPMEDIHLYSKQEAEIEPNGSMEYVYILFAVGIFIILLACINFMNLATARSANRAKEVGVRKTLGSMKSNLIGQFLTESIMYCFLAALFSILLIDAILPYFNSLAGKSLTSSLVFSPVVLLVLLLFVIIVGVFAGSYPAFYLTSFNPIEVLKGKVKSGLKSSGLRSSLVVFQFTISIILIICTILVYNQLSYIKGKNLGYEKENTIVISNAGRLEGNFEAFKNSLSALPEVISYTSASHMPSSEYGYNNTVFKVPGSQQDHLISYLYVDYDYFKTLNIDFKEGRSFSRDFPSDSLAVILNEAAVKYLGFSEGLGNEIGFAGRSDKFEPLKIIGVTNDFHYESLTKAIKPLAFVLIPKSYLIAIKLTPGNLRERVQLIESKWKELAPGEPFEYTFLDEKFQALYNAEQRLSQVFTLFTILAIFIACLGLLGLAAYTAEQKTKEIGVRKVMGASSFDVVFMLSKEFTRLVIISFVIAIPVAYYAMDQWLQNFAYKVEIGVGAFIIAGISTIVVAWLTVSFQSAKAARVNPVKSLRTE